MAQSQLNFLGLAAGDPVFGVTMTKTFKDAFLQHTTHAFYLLSKFRALQKDDSHKPMYHVEDLWLKVS